MDGSDYFFSVVLANQKRKLYDVDTDEGRKRVIGIMAAILASRNVQSADDLFGGPQGSPRTEKLIAASIQWARGKDRYRVREVILVERGLEDS